MEPCESFTLAVSWKILQRRNPSLQSSLNALLYFLWLLCKPFSKTGSFQHSTRILKILFSHPEVQGTEYIGDWIHRGLLFCILSKHSNPGSPLPLCGQVLHGAFLFEKYQKEVVLVSIFIYISKLQGRQGRPFQELLIIPFFIMDLQILRASKNLGDIPLSMDILLEYQSCSWLGQGCGATLYHFQRLPWMVPRTTHVNSILILPPPTLCAE